MHYQIFVRGYGRVFELRFWLKLLFSRIFLLVSTTKYINYHFGMLCACLSNTITQIWNTNTSAKWRKVVNIRIIGINLIDQRVEV